MNRRLRIAAFAALMLIGVLAGALLKRTVTGAPMLGFDARGARAEIGAIGRPSTAKPALPPQSITPLSHARSAPAPKYHPRDLTEWQGMLVDLSLQANCELSTQCGLAMACHDGKCGPCTRDDQCGTGEGCVLDHCLLQSGIGCRSRRDCAPDELCVLSGYSDDARSNGELTAQCLAAKGGLDEPIVSPRKNLPGGPTPVRADEMMRDLRERPL